MALIHFLIVVAVALIFFAGHKIPDALRLFGNGPRGGPPTHPLPATSPIETSRGSGDPDGEARRSARHEGAVEVISFPGTHHTN